MDSSPFIGHAPWDDYQWPTGEHLKPTRDLIETGMALETIDQAEDRTRQVAEDYLNDVARELFPNGARTDVISGENPAKEIIRYALRENIDLIALATHGRTGLTKIMMGSVAAELLQAHVAPLFLVRPEGLNYNLSMTAAQRREAE